MTPDDDRFPAWDETPIEPGRAAALVLVVFALWAALALG